MPRRRSTTRAYDVLTLPSGGDDGQAALARRIGSFVIDVGQKLHPRKQDLYDLIRGIDGDVGLVTQAVNLIEESDHPRKLARALESHELDYGRTFESDLRVAMTVAAMNIDRVQPDAAVAEPSRGGRKTQSSASTQKAQRVISVIAALLQEYVAYDIIPISRVQETFAAHPPIVAMVEEVSRITRQPITSRIPDAQGMLRRRDILFNKTQYALGQDLVLGTRNPARVALIKIADALEKLRVMGKGRGDEAARTLLRLHIQEMYLPLVGEMETLRPIQREMQHLLLHQLDPDAERSIRVQLDAMRAQANLAVIQEKILAGLERQGFGTDSIASVTGRVKAPWSIQQKLLVMPREDDEKAFDSAREALAGQLDRGELNAGAYNDAMRQLQKDFDEKCYPVYRLSPDARITGIYDIYAFRFVLPDSFTLKGHINARQNHARLKGLRNALIHAFEPMPRRHKDYVAKPKPNGYAAIHDGLIIKQLGTEQGLEVEVQMVTQSMHEANGHGEAHHGVHKAMRAAGKDLTDTRPHPDTTGPTRGKLRHNMMAHLQMWMGARLNGRELPEHQEWPYIVVGGADGVLHRLEKTDGRAPTLGDFGRSLRIDFWSGVEAAEINGQRLTDDAYRQALNRPLPHAATVRFTMASQPQPMARPPRGFALALRRAASIPAPLQTTPA